MFVKLNTQETEKPRWEVTKNGMLTPVAAKKKADEEEEEDENENEEERAEHWL